MGHNCSLYMYHHYCKSCQRMIHVMILMGKWRASDKKSIIYFKVSDILYSQLHQAYKEYGHIFINKNSPITAKYRLFNQSRGPSWSWSHDSWIYNYLSNQCLSPLTLWIWIPLMAKFVSDSPQVGGTPVSSTNKTDSHDIAEILLKKVFKNPNPNPLTQSQSK